MSFGIRKVSKVIGLHLHAIYGVLGGFHLAQTMIRSYAKLVFDLDLLLTKSILLEGLESQLIVQKGSDLRKHNIGRSALVPHP